MVASADARTENRRRYRELAKYMENDSRQHMASGFQRRRVNNHPLRCSKMQHLVAENSSSKKTPRCRSCGRKRMRKAGRAGGRAGSVEDKAKAGRAASPSKKREKKKSGDISFEAEFFQIFNDAYDLNFKNSVEAMDSRLVKRCQSQDPFAYLCATRPRGQSQDRADQTRTEGNCRTMHR